jgi:hypothetical protein
VSFESGFSDGLSYYRVIAEADNCETEIAKSRRRDVQSTVVDSLMSFDRLCFNKLNISVSVLVSEAVLEGLAPVVEIDFQHFFSSSVN